MMHQEEGIPRLDALLQIKRQMGDSSAKSGPNRHSAESASIFSDIEERASPELVNRNLCSPDSTGTRCVGSDTEENNMKCESVPNNNNNYDEDIECYMNYKLKDEKIKHVSLSSICDQAKEKNYMVPTVEENKHAEWSNGRSNCLSGLDAVSPTIYESIVNDDVKIEWKEKNKRAWGGKVNYIGMLLDCDDKILRGFKNEEIHLNTGCGDNNDEEDIDYDSNKTVIGNETVAANEQNIPNIWKPNVGGANGNNNF